MNIEAKTVDASRVETVHIVRPNHLNGANRLFGGILMQWIDEVAGIVAKIGCLEVILHSLASKVDCRWKLTGVTVCAGILLTFATGVASVPIISLIVIALSEPP